LANLIDETRLGLTVLSQSEHDVVVVKPAGMATELTRDPRRESLIWQVRNAVAEGIQPRLVHRLDRVTRGVMIVSLTKFAAAFYGEQIREGLWEKYYLARIPTPRPAEFPHHAQLVGRHKAFIKEGTTKATIVRAGGKASFLEILAVDPAPGRPGESHALIRLLTGRLHQIRVMFAGLDLPLVGDELYGGAPGPLYLEHVALFYVDCATRDVRMAHVHDDPQREKLGPAISKRLARLVRA
jgi:23S rRNA-/tRNA-specific pseudouridylate synthase